MKKKNQTAPKFGLNHGAFVMSRARRFFPTHREAKKAFREYFGFDYGDPEAPSFSVEIYYRKNAKGARRYFVGTYLEWLNI